MLDVSLFLPSIDTIDKQTWEGRNFMKRIIPYPLFLITAIILERVTISSAQIGIVQSLRSLVILLLFATVASFILQYFIKDWQRADFMVLLVPVAFIVYRSLYRAIKLSFPHQANILGIGLIILLGVLYIVIVRRKIWQSLRNPTRVIAYFNLVFIVLLSFQAVRIGKESYPHLKNMVRSRAATSLEHDSDPTLQKAVSPDIYVIVLDGYARQDVLRKIYGYDNSEFIAWLDERGFYVATETHSNYVQTPYTMASFWNFDYLPTWDSSSEYEQYLYQPIQNNRVFRLLDEIGYTTVSTEGAVHYTEIRNSDVYLSSFLPLNDFETLLLIDSPLEPLSNIVDLHLPLQTYKTHRDRFYYQLETLKKIPLEIKSPKTVYTHILLPHPPFIFDQAGHAREIVGSFSLAEGAEFQGGKEEYVSGYRAQVKIINGEIMKVVDAILTKSETAPVIVIMGDHGPASMFRFRVDDPGCIWERTSNLYAILLPGHKEDGTLYPSISPVNTFRVIFNTYFGTDLHLLEDRSYLRYWQQPTLNVDVTSIRDSLDQCTIAGTQGK